MLKSVAINRLLKALKLNKDNLLKLLMYLLLLNLQFQVLELLATGLIELKTF
jgi:hypothetical protein